MTRHYIEGATAGDGDRLFYLEEEDNGRKPRMTVYRERTDANPNASLIKLAIRYDPIRKRFAK
ncbi:MAG: hypothetical protein GYA56_10890 [Geobacteraceae bacterium]|jgi:hypothetical protein|nr:hypothetical protein [Geobacteraceae bacterium]